MILAMKTPIFLQQQQIKLLILSNDWFLTFKFRNLQLMTNQQSSNSLVRHPEVSELLIHQSTIGNKPTQFQFSFSKISLLDVVNKCSLESSPTKFCRYFQFPHTPPPPPKYMTYPLHLWSQSPNTRPSAKITVTCYVTHSNLCLSLKDSDILQLYTTNAKIIVSSHNHQCFVGQTKTSDISRFKNNLEATVV